MPKINQEEYEILKEKSSGGYEWIARDESGSCFVFELKPIKDHRYELWEWVGSTRIGKIFNSSLFQFIQWEDSEPYNIQELIEEYEHESFKEAWVKQPVQIDTFNFDESEETEVKSIQDLIDKWDNYKNVARTVANSRAIEHADMFINDLEQLDEPEVLSDKWIDEHKIVQQSVHGRNDYVPVDDLQNLLVPKQELPVIPKFVADYIQSSKGEDITLFSAMRDAFEDDENKIHDWLWDGSGDDSFQTFAKAWLAYPNIDVEEEQKYQVKDNHGRTLLAKMTYSHKGKTFEEVQPYNELIVGYKKELTEQEIKDYDSRFWPFAVKIEEMEE